MGDVEGPQFVENFNERVAIQRYQRLITELPPLNKQLLLYILDLLAVFAAKSDENRMNSQNLAAIFQPGMLSHPDHAMAPEEYRLNQCVIIFLIENQDHFLIGMQGTAADDKTRQEVESGTPTVPVTPNPNRLSGLGRSASNASAGAESVRRDGQLRRNRSVSSRNSRHEGSNTPNSPALAATPTTSGLGRSNTLPSKKSPALTGGRFQRHDGSSPRSPAHLEPLTQMRVEEVNESERLDLAPGVGTTHLAPIHATNAGRSQERLLETSQDPPTPTKDRKLPSIFQRAPTGETERREPNKLKKKRIPGSLNASAQSSNASFHQMNAPSPSYEISNPLEQTHPVSTDMQQQQQQHQLPQPQYQQPQHQQPQYQQVQSQQPQPQPQYQQVQSQQHQTQQQQQMPPPPQQQQQQQRHPLVQGESVGQEPVQKHEQPQSQQLPAPATSPRSDDVSSDITPRASQVSSNQSLHPDNTLKGKKSPPASIHSSFNEGSDIDQVIDEQQSVSTIEQAEKEKKRRWRLSRSRGGDNGSSPGPGVTSPRIGLGSNDNADVSNVSIGSSSYRPRKSESSEPTERHGSFDGRDESKSGPIGWIRNKYREAKETAEQRRNRSPPADGQNLTTPFVSRGKSLDMKRESPPKEPERPTGPTIQAVPSVTPLPAPVPIPIPAAVPAPVPSLGQQHVPTPPNAPQRPQTPPPQKEQPLHQPQQSPKAPVEPEQQQQQPSPTAPMTQPEQPQQQPQPPVEQKEPPKQE